MHVAQVTVSIDPCRGGQERFVADLIGELTKMGHEVTLITCDRTYQCDANCDVNYIQGWNLAGLPVIPSINDLVRALSSGFDVVHLHYHALFGEVVASACLLSGQTLVTTMHSEMKRSVHKILYDRIQLRTISRLSDQVICLSEGMKRALVRRGLNEQKIRIIPNAMYVKEFQSQAARLKGTVHSNGGFDLFFVGRLEKRKGVQYLLKALSLLKTEGFTPTLKIAGKGVYKHKLISLVEKNDLLSQVCFASYISREDLLRSYLDAKCVVIPSLYEGVPSVAIEALALGKPVIVTSILGMESIISKRLGCTVPPRDYEALARAIRRILSLEDYELRRIRSEGKEFAKQYDWSRVTKTILLAYQNSRDDQAGYQQSKLHE